MPTYEYRCKSCRKGLEVVQSFTDDPLTECPKCGGQLRKVFGSIGITFKGSGFYKTDSRSGSSTAAKSSESVSSSSDGASSSGDSSSSSDGASTSGDSSSSSDSGSGSKDGKVSKDAKASKDAKDAKPAKSGSKGSSPAA